MIDDVMSDLPPMPCPVCRECDHDLRGGVLELMENVGQNLKDAGAHLLDAMEAEGDGSVLFSEAMVDFAGVREQLAVILEAIPEIALIKAAHSE